MMAKCKTWDCKICGTILENKYEFTRGSYRLGTPTDFGRVCIDCMNSKTNLVRAGTKIDS